MVDAANSLLPPEYLSTAGEIGRIERGVVAWPRALRRAAYRTVLGASRDEEIGLVNRRRRPTDSSRVEGIAERPTGSAAVLSDEVLAGSDSAMAPRVSVDMAGLDGAGNRAEAVSSGLEFALDWRHGVDVAADLWRGNVLRRDLLKGVSFNAAVFLAPAIRWLTAPSVGGPVGDGGRLVGEPDVETVRRITQVYRGLDNQFGGGHVRDNVIRFLDTEVSDMLRGRYDARTGTALFAAAAEATQLGAWASYDIGEHGLAQRYMIQALRLAATAGDRALGAEILAAMSHQAAYLRAPTAAIDLARAAGRAAAEVHASAIEAESAVLEAQGHAVGGDERSCAAALDRAERAFDRADRSSAPPWIGYFDESYLAAKFGHCFTLLGRGDLSIRFAERSLEMDGLTYARGRQFNLALLARPQPSR